MNIITQTEEKQETLFEEDITKFNSSATTSLVNTNINYTSNDTYVAFHLIAVDNNDSVDTIKDNVINKFALNKKQKVAFEKAIANIVQRTKGEEVTQNLIYVGGPRVTGKSQIIKAIVSFHTQIWQCNTLCLCSYTGTAAKIIGGSTISSLVGLRKVSTSKLEKKWHNVNTLLLDEVSMVGKRLLAKINKNITRAKNGNADVLFGGIDIIFFGDFVQFPPVLDSPLYSDYKSNTIALTRSNSDIKKI